MNRNRNRATSTRRLLAREAARLMYEERVKQYMDAKYMAARRLFGRKSSRGIRFQPRHLPSNGEIQEALWELAELTEGHLRQDRLFAMRVRALHFMEHLEPFDPRLIGSVSTGKINRSSDIDLHVFVDEIEVLEIWLHERGWTYEIQEVCIRVGGEFRDYQHVYIEDDFAVELSVYPLQEKKITRRSSTDGKPIRRVKPGALREIIKKEHAQSWEGYQKTGEILHLEEILDVQEFETLADVEEAQEYKESGANVGVWGQNAPNRCGQRPRKATNHNDVL